MFNSEPMRLLETTKYSLSDYVIIIVEGCPIHPHNEIPETLNRHHEVSP